MIEWIAYVSLILLVLDVSQCQIDNAGVRKIQIYGRPNYYRLRQCRYDAACEDAVIVKH